MPDIFDYPVFPEMPFLEALARELENTFNVIAYAGHHTNKRFIRERRASIRRKYGPYLDHVDSDVGVFHIIPAYQTLQNLLRDNLSPEDIRIASEECLREHLEGSEPGEDYLDAFREFYAKNPETLEVN